MSPSSLPSVFHATAYVTQSMLGPLATWIPAQRALSIDPIMLLREE
jgi:ABC-type lipoprotein release transport system permease subunit